MNRERFFPCTRQFTGTPRVTRAYVGDRLTGRCVVGCPHRHRSERTAKLCAERLCKAFVRAPDAQSGGETPTHTDLMVPPEGLPEYLGGEE